jgi:hypothetical protein
MKENISNKLLIVCCLLAVMGCHTRKKLLATNPQASATSAAPANNIEDKLNSIRAQQTNFNTFSGKAKTSLNINGDTHDVTLNIRIANNQKIWVSITGLLSIEGARAVITPDSIMVLNRLQSIYLKKPFSFIYAYTNKQIDYPMLQALFTGNVVPKLLNDSARYTAAGDSVKLDGKLGDLVYKLLLGSDLKVTRTDLMNDAEGQSLQVNNSFIVQNNQKVPAQIDIISLAKSNKIEVNLHFVKVEYNQPQDYPFVIPPSYAPAQ